jgi:hypothetical protein
LDTPIPTGKSAVWCGSLQLAWNRLKKLAGGPVEIAGAEKLCKALNSSTFAEADLAPGSFYATAGVMNEQTSERIRKEMANMLPTIPPPKCEGGNDGTGLLAYAYLDAQVDYEQPFMDDEQGVTFTDEEGTSLAVHSFGIPGKSHRQTDREPMARQIEVLFDEVDRAQFHVGEFALDLSKHSQPYQVLIARVQRQQSLADMLEALDQRIKAAEREKKAHQYHYSSDLEIPNLSFRLVHRFRELEGAEKPIINGKLKGQYIETAEQMIDFRLDRTGAKVTSEAKVQIKSAMGAPYYCNGPFLVCVKKRGSTQPCLVMWVANAELLQRE